MRKVFVMNKSGHDMSDAERYGELQVLTKGEIFGKYHLLELYRMIKTAFTDCHADDFILISGPTTLCCIACVVFALQHKRLNLLLFTRGSVDTRGEYISRTIVFDEEVQI